MYPSLGQRRINLVTATKETSFAMVETSFADADVLNNLVFSSCLLPIEQCEPLPQHFEANALTVYSKANLSIQIANGRDYEAVEAQRRVNGDHRGFTMWSAIMLSAHRMWSGKIDGI